jgi:hypothetical protein
MVSSQPAILISDVCFSSLCDVAVDMRFAREGSGTASVVCPFIKGSSGVHVLLQRKARDKRKDVDVLYLDDA